ncbi:MAG: amidohydrolase family protein [Melioribacteraceae bacterium]|nr:MAG: amidohydrolase family protein [Melioribacteraceae bacterium]
MKIANAWICSIKKNSISPVFGDLILSDGKIKEIKKKNWYDYLNGKTRIDKNAYDAKGKVITIPNVNFHEHIYSRLSKGLPISGPTDNFINILKNLWWKLDCSLDHEMTSASAEMASLESIKNGVTYIFDHHASPRNTIGSLDVIGDVLRKRKLNGVLAFETSDRNGELLKTEGIIENSSRIDFVDPDIKYLFGLHASFTFNNDTLKTVSDFINENDLGIHIHLCEDPADRKISKDKFGNLPLTRLIKYNLLNDKSIISHAIHLTKSEYKKIYEYGSAIAFNPDSNLNNSVGVPNFNNIPKEQIILCGTDGMHADPAKTLKTFFLLMRHSGLSSDEAFERVIYTYFNQIKFVKKFFPGFSTLNKNDKADFIIWDYVPPTPFNKNNFWGHYIYGIAESQVSSTVKGGKFLMKDKRLIGINESEVQKEIYKQGERLFKEFKKLR